MKKLTVLALLSVALLATEVFAGPDGGAFGLQLGPITFGLGGSSNGPIIGIGPSPDNGLPFSAVVVPGGCCCTDRCRRSCSSCTTCDSCPREEVVVVKKRRGYRGAPRGKVAVEEVVYDN